MAPPPTRPTGRRWRRLVTRIVTRDQGTCHLCHRPGATTADHLITIKDGGAWWNPNNLAAAHVLCNKIRGDRSIAWARARLAPTNNNDQRSPTRAAPTW